MALPRGIRNNNPLNIRKGNSWQGERHPQTDTQFEEFVSMEYGIRAAIKLIRNYINGNVGSHIPCYNIYRLVNRWAPSSENNTKAYIDAVEKLSGIHRYEKLDPDNRNQISKIVAAMAFVECGEQIDEKLIRSAWELL